MNILHFGQESQWRKQDLANSMWKLGLGHILAWMLFYSPVLEGAVLEPLPVCVTGKIVLKDLRG